jgi:hypothetical protein
VSKDLEHLSLLVTFHYIVGAITALFCSFPLIHVFIGLMVMFKPGVFDSGGKQEFPTRLFGLFFVLIGGGFVLFGWTLGALTAYAGRCISRREKYTFCLVVACVNCLHQPIGIALGIFTLIVLSRDSVKALFRRGQSTAPPPADWNQQSR